MSGVSRRLLWAATCLAALCVAAAQTPNSSVAPNVTEIVTSKPVPTTLTPTALPGGRPPLGPTRGVGGARGGGSGGYPVQHGRPGPGPRPEGRWGGRGSGRA